jgi:hypothetical protein
MIRNFRSATQRLELQRSQPENLGNEHLQWRRTALLALPPTPVELKQNPRDPQETASCVRLGLGLGFRVL